MEEISYILFGWLLGLLAPTIVDKIGSQYSKKQFFKATCTELYDLQYRVAIVCFLLGQRFGEIDKEFLLWIQPIIRDYKGNEPNESSAKLIDMMLNAKESEFNDLIEHMRSDPSKGMSLKTFSASFLDSNISLLSKLPLELQSNIHEFRNHLNTLNQEIEIARESLKMTFDSSISDENHKILVSDLKSKYSFIQGMCRRVSSKLETVLSSTL